MNKEQQELPEGWELIELGKVVKLKNGFAFKSVDFSDHGVPVIRISDIKNENVSLKKSVFIPEHLVNESFLVEKGDLLIAMSGATTGKVGVYNEPKKALQNQRVGNFRIIDTTVLDSKYRNYYVSSLRTEIEKAAYGGAQPNISAKIIESFGIPLPPLGQQKQIVAKIEELFSHIDAGIESLKKAKALLKQYRQSVLKSAVTGDLTKDWRAEHGCSSVAEGTTPRATETPLSNIEPASQLLKRILKERQQRWEQQLEQFQAKGKPPKNDKWKEKYQEPVNVTQDSAELPESWSWSSIDSLTDMISGHAFKKAEYSSEGVRLFQIANVSFGFTNWSEEEHLPLSYLDEWKHLSLSEGDVVMALNRPLLSRRLKISKISSSDLPAILYQRVGKFNFYDKELADYFLIFMQSDAYIGQLESQLQGVNIPFINKGKLLGSRISIPSCKEECKEIVQRVEEKLTAADRLMTELDTKLTQAQQQKQTILASAFKGELV